MEDDGFYDIVILDLFICLYCIIIFMIEQPLKFICECFLCEMCFLGVVLSRTEQNHLPNVAMVQASKVIANII